MPQEVPGNPNDVLLEPQVPPPPDYYACNLRYLLEEVLRRSGELLTGHERRFIQAFGGLSTPAQRLFARLVSRRGPWLRVDRLQYAEVDNLPGALGELAEAGLVEHTPPAPADHLLNLLTRPEQQRLFPAVRAATKPAWVARCLGHYPDTLIRQRMAPRHPWVGVKAADVLRVCCVLFFGDDTQDLSAFVLQDLGVRRYESYPLGPESRPFADRTQLDRYLLCRRVSPWSHRLDEFAGLASGLRVLVQPAALSRTEQRTRDRILNRMGRWHERRGELDLALHCYRFSTAHPARERQARIYRTLGDKLALDRILHAMRGDPWGPEEQDFAERFGRRHNRTALPVSWCGLAGPTPDPIERHALTLLTGNGGQGWHLENALPLGLCGLAFWDEIFAPVAGAFSHPFQAGPRDLFWPDFARARRTALDARIEALAPPGALAARLRETFAAKQGIANRLVNWGAMNERLLESLIRCVPAQLLLDIAVYVVHNLHRARTGFPDLLMIYGPGAWELVEVKGPTDQLQPAQRVWLGALERMAIPARVLRFRAPC